MDPDFPIWGRNGRKIQAKKRIGVILIRFLHGWAFRARFARGLLIFRPLGIVFRHRRDLVDGIDDLVHGLGLL